MAQQDGKTLRVSLLAACVISLLSVGSAMAAEASSNVDPESVFRKAMSERNAGELYNAADDFNEILSNQPKLHRARLELAVTYYRLLDYEEAQKQAQVVLDDPKTPPNVRLAILAFLAQVKKDAEQVQKRNTWRPNVSVGYMHDTNVNVGPSGDVVNVGGLVLTLDQNSKAQPDDALLLSAGISHTYQTGQRVRIGQRNAMFLWQSNAGVYRRDYRKLNTYDLDVISAGTGPSLIVPRHLRMNLNFQGDYIRLGNAKLAMFKSISPTVTWNYPTGEFTIDGTYSWRHFYRPEDNGRDGHYQMYGGYWGQYLLHGRVATQLGYQWFREKTAIDRSATASNGTVYTGSDNRRFSNDGTNLFAGVNVATWTNGSVYGKWNKMDIQYAAPEPVANVSRDETQTQYSIGVKHTFKTPGFFKDAVLDASITKIRNKSNVTWYTYDRDQTMITLSKTFN